MNADWVLGGCQPSDQASWLGLRVRWKLAATIHIRHRRCYYYSTCVRVCICACVRACVCGWCYTNKSVFSLISSAVSMALSASSTQRRAAAPVPLSNVDRYLLPADCSAANLPHVAAVVEWWDRWTDGLTDTQPLHKPCSRSILCGSASEMELFCSYKRRWRTRLVAARSAICLITGTMTHRAPLTSISLSVHLLSINKLRWKTPLLKVTVSCIATVSKSICSK